MARRDPGGGRGARHADPTGRLTFPDMEVGMRRDSRKTLGLAALLAAGLFNSGTVPTKALADDPPPSRLGRLFRMGSPNSPAAKPPAPRSITPDLLGPPNDVGAPASPSPTVPPPTIPPVSSSTPPSAGQRIVPQPRVSRAATESDPILTRVSIGRSDNGTQFGMFLQVFADGTVLDGEGTHHVGREAMRPLVEAIQSTDAYRLKGHCGGPPTDFTEQVHVVVYERALGKLRANAFSYSGNPQGCEPGIKTLQTAIDAFQAKLAGTSPAATASPAPPASVPTSGETISLTPTP